MRILLGSLLALLLVSLSASVRADQKKKDEPNKNDNRVEMKDWGKPKEFEVGKLDAYWIWHEDGIWHFRTTGGGKNRHQFVGRIVVGEGKLTALQGKKGEYRGKNVDQYVFNPKSIAFNFITDEKMDGLDFTADPLAKEIKFSLQMDGRPAPKHIYIGKNGRHPDTAEFTVPAHPVDDAGGKEKKKEK